jgi:serine/threonine protein kinase
MKLRRNTPATAAPTTFPGYANIAEIATGTFATVYRGVELGTKRAVALKVIKVADTSSRMVEVFDKELGALALLSNHPNVTTLYGSFFTPEGRPVLVLELCRESLAQRVRLRGPLPPAEVIQVGVKIAGALETAHRSGFLHRDMKPQNILASQFGEPVLADFGAAALQAAAQSTEGVFGFTTLHAPPEALEGQPLHPAADIYGLASSMYQLLLGHGPFAAYEGEAPASVILRILRDPAPRPPLASAPIALADLMENALAKDPDKRPQSAGAFAESLRAIEALAGWPQTPYVVWASATPPGWDGADQGRPADVPGPAEEAGAGAARREHLVASRLSELLQ